MGIGTASKETKQAAEQQRGESRNRSVVLPDGLYSLAITEHTVMTSKKSTQAMAIIKLAPCTEAGVTATADLSKELPLFVMGQDYEDEEAFRAAVVDSYKNRYEKQGDEIGPAPEDLTKEDIDTLVSQRLTMSHRQTVDNAVAIFGRKELPEVPRWDAQNKQFVFADGSLTDKIGKDTAC